ncbi:MAG: hypothetical protein JHD15_07110 [Phenylobacterium sp.]|uniref:lytic transglycosylase domain-containing protein n=1 Tax=Phenylobacterium sp. TaxID=1871053 RepID=UPI001A2B40ED|nr:lytic transglycosylase domain-containing protein [Phenylobacterium sp.]MBJ7410122.1 hypothetical protein [Phenylobacterium sp.]
MVQAYRTDDPWGGVARGYSLGNALRGDVARSRAGSALAGGDYAGGANALLTNGDIEAGLRVQDYGAWQQSAAAAAEKAAEEEGLKFTTEIAGRLAEVHRSSKDLNATLAAFDQVVPQLQKYDSPEEIAQLRQRIAQDPDNTLVMLGAGAAKQLGYDVRNAGDEVLVIDKATGQLVTRYRGARTVNIPEGGALYELPGTGDPIPAAPEAEEAGAAGEGISAAPASAPTNDVEAVWQAAIQQESGGRGDAVGPQTDYGRAYGSTQMLPATAEAMARKLGIAWNPALMRENSPKALAYQDRLGRAYFEEGLEKYGNVEDALRYYHGGPNEKLWGPKTEAHVRAVMSRVQPYEVASAGETPPPPSGARLIASRPKGPKEQWVDLPGGGQRNTVTGKTEGVPKTSGRLSATVIKLQDDLLRDLGAASSVNTLIDKFAGQLDRGELNLGPVSNIGAQVRNFVGASDDGSRNFASFRAAMEKMRNDSLRLNKGVQTEGDAQRAWNELLANINDEGVVVQRLAEIKALNEQAIALRSDLVNQAREDSGFAPLDAERFRAKPLPSGGVRDVKTPAEARALPPGTRFRTPDGQVRVRQ